MKFEEVAGAAQQLNFIKQIAMSDLSLVNMRSRSRLWTTSLRHRWFRMTSLRCAK